MLDKNQELSLTLSLSFTGNVHSNSSKGLQTTSVCSKKEGCRSYLNDGETKRLCSPHSTITCLQSGKRSAGESNTSNNSEEEDGDGGRKKLRLSKEQAAVLEDSFKEHNTLSPKEKHALANRLNLHPRQVEVWFQNRRARTKLKQTEVDLELLKRCFNNLSEENRRMHKEVEELRALKLSSQFYMNMTPPTTLTMCPSCKRMTSSRDARS